ncbi:hypothetical protein PFISCL1PPCAC_16122, partial [Pristionchus fissidentatus]
SPQVSLPSSLLTSLHSLRRESNSTTFAVLLSIYRLFVYKTAGFADFPIGVMVEQRNEHNCETMGCFVNSCVLRSPLDSSHSFSSFSRQLQQSLHDLRLHSAAPFDEVVATVQQETEDTTSPLFQILFVMDTVTTPAAGDRFTLIKTPSRTAKYEQTWYITNYGSELSLKVEYRTDLFEETTIKTSIDYMLFLLQKLSDDDGLAMRDLTLMRPSDTLHYNEEKRAHLRDHSQFTHILRSRSDCGGVCFNQALMKTKKVRKMSNKIARVLRQEFLFHFGESHRPDDFLVLYVHRSDTLVPLVLAGVQAGFCIAPLSLDWPLDRRRAALSTMTNVVYITDRNDEDGVLTLCLSSLLDRARSLTSPRRSLPLTLPSDLVYATFTSGTTGQPKCVCTSGEGMGNLLMNYSREYCVGSHSSIYQVINYAFDIFFCDIFFALLNGAELTLASGAIPQRKEMDQARPTHCFVMPAFLNFTDDFDLWTRLDTVLVTGETMQKRAFRSLLGAGVPLHQLYGATEQTINNTSQRLRVDSPRRAVGRAYQNLGVRAIDGDGQPLPHLWPALTRYTGPGLARGLLRQAELTEKKFPDDDSLLREDRILNADCRCFESGDVLKKYFEGNLIFAGRNDRMRKIRGKTVDLAEVERALSSLPHIAGCLVRVSDDQQLIAYVVSDSTEDMIKEELEKSLPSHAVPSHVIRLHVFPTNANGKVDVKALPNPCAIETTVDALREPRNDLEERLKAIFESLLQKKMSIDDCFFSSGGNSLLAMIAVQRIESQLSLSFPLKRLFQLRTIAKIAESVLEKEPTEVTRIPTQPTSIVPLHRISLSPQQRQVSSPPSSLPLTPQQSQMYFLSQQDNNNNHYNVPFVQRFEKKIVKLDLLILALHFIRQSNEALRTHLIEMDGEPRQAVVSATE